MSVRCELYKLLLTCVKLLSPLKIPISTSSCWFSNSHGARTVLHLEARKELRRRPKIFNDADAHLTNQLVPNSTTGSILSIHVHKIIVLMSTFVPHKTTPRENRQLFASAAFKKAKTFSSVSFKGKIVFFSTFALKNQTQTGVWQL